MTGEDRPAHAVWDCELGKQIDVPYSDQEWQEHRARIMQDAADRAAAAKADAELRAKIAAEPNELVRMMAEKALLAPVPGSVRA